MLPLLVIGGLWLWGYRFTPGGFKNAPPLVADTTARLTGISITTTDSNRVDRIPVNGEVPAVALTNQSTVNDRAQVTIPTENNLAQQLLEMIVPDTLDYVAILPGWVTWRTREGHYDSLSLQSDREMLSFQQIEQRLLSYDDLIDMLNDSELDSAAKIVLLRDGNHFNLIWYH
jgi:hypothetical protein